jgi:segregation and condensation protein A
MEDFEYGYKVELETFSGPLDLLLYLIRQEEVEIADVPIARITDQYLQHIEALEAINVNVAGEFLLLAATLMEIKSRMLLARHEGAGEEDEEDPRADLIRQLLEYKKFKDAARALAQRADAQALKFARGAAAALGLPERPPDEDLPLALGDLTPWDLVAAFKTILQQTSVDLSHHVALDRKSLAAYCTELLELLTERTTCTFREVFPRGADRMTIVGLFVALLELVRRRRVRAEQAAASGEIRIVLLDPTPLTEAELPVEGAPERVEGQGSRVEGAEGGSQGACRSSSDHASRITPHASSPPPVLLLDTVGELARVYALGTVVFVGGSLHPHGGHNIIEPSALAKPVLFGPHTDNFRDVTDELLAAAAAQCVADEGELEAACRRLLADPAAASVLGTRARQVVERHRGATERTLEAIGQFLP